MDITYSEAYEMSRDKLDAAVQDPSFTAFVEALAYGLAAYGIAKATSGRDRRAEAHYQIQAVLKWARDYGYEEVTPPIGASYLFNCLAPEGQGKCPPPA
jgi:hypothetical protein